MDQRDIVGKPRFHEVLLIFGVMLTLVAVAGTALESSPLQFTATPDILYLNWTNLDNGNYRGNITVSNSRDFAVSLSIVDALAFAEIHNSTGFDAPFSVYNGSSYFNQINLSASPSSGVFSLVVDQSKLAPGRYSGDLTIVDSSNLSINISNLAVVLDAPINFTSGGDFSGNLSDTRNTFYFSPSGENVTGLWINLPAGIEADLFDGEMTLVSNWDSTNGNLTYNSSSLTDGYFRIELSDLTYGSGVYTGEVVLLKESFDVNDGEDTINFVNNIERNDTMTYKFWINNSADYPVTITSMSNSSNRLNNSINFVEFSTNLGSNVIDPLSSVLVTLSVDIDTNKTADALGNYAGWFAYETDSGYPYTLRNLTVNLDLNSELLLNVTGGTEWVSNTSSNSTVLVNVTPSYSDGEAISLPLGGFQAFLVPPSEVAAIYEEKNITEGSTYETFSDVHRLSLIVPSELRPGGLYGVKVNAANVSLFGSNTTGDYLKINSSGLYFSDFSIESTSFDVGVSKSITARVKNIGYQDATGVLPTLGWTNNCVEEISSPSPQDISSGDEKIYTWTVTGLTNVVCKLTVSSDSSGIWYASTRDITDIAVGNAVAPVGGGTSDINTPATDPPIVLDLQIIDYPDIVRIMQGGEETFTVVVKNNGNEEFTDVFLSITGIEDNWYTVSNNVDVRPGDKGVFGIIFNVSDGAGIGNYSFEFVVDGGSVITSVPFTLSIFPGQDLISSIPIDLDELRGRLTQIKLDRDKLLEAGGNVENLDLFVSQLEDLFDRADAFVTLDDTLSAYVILDDIRAMLEIGEVEVFNLRRENIVSISGFDIAKGSYDMFIALSMGAVVLALIGAFVYMGLPPKQGYIHGQGYYHVSGNRKRAKVHAAFNKAREHVGPVREKVKNLYERVLDRVGSSKY